MTVTTPDSCPARVETRFAGAPAPPQPEGVVGVCDHDLWAGVPLLAEARQEGGRHHSKKNPFWLWDDVPFPFLTIHSSEVIWFSVFEWIPILFLATYRTEFRVQLQKHWSRDDSAWSFFCGLWLDWNVEYCSATGKWSPLVPLLGEAFSGLIGLNSPWLKPILNSDYTELHLLTLLIFSTHSIPTLP